MAERPPPGALAGFVHGLLAYIDSPWKAAVVAVLAILAFAGWIFHRNQEAIIEAWLTPSVVSLRTAEIPAALEKLVEGSDADLVQIWSVDLAVNAQRFLGARRRDGERPVIPEPRRLPVIVTVSDIRALVNVIEGTPVCVELTDHGSPLARRVFERGMRWGCAQPIPPGPSSLVGVIYLSWIVRPEQSQELVAVTAAREIAGGLVNR